MADNSTVKMGDEKEIRRKRVVVMSSEMFFSPKQTQSYAESLRSLLPDEHLDKVDVYFLPDNLSLPLAAAVLHDSNISYGGQNCYSKDYGAFTGEVSAAMFKDLGCSIVQIGHALRRRLFHETDEDIAAKAAKVCRNDMIPLICIGEQSRGTLDSAIAECTGQLESALRAVTLDAEVIIAYQPARALSGTEPSPPGASVHVVKALREQLQSRRGTTRFIYNGCAQSGLFEWLADELDGLLLDGSAHDPKRLAEVVGEVAGYGRREDPSMLGDNPIESKST